VKILIEVTTPGNGKTYEIKLDDKLTVGVAKEKILEQITSFENGCIDFAEGVAMFAMSTRSKLDDSDNIRKAGVRSGHKVFLL